jgi:carbonic anhydrase/acetyltransferase-like protein (isoleucine patch superfamily)
MQKPTIDSSVFVAPGAVILGDVTIEKNCSIWYNSTIRCIEAPILIGEGSNVQDNAVIHVSHNQPVTIGSYVTIGHGAIIHGCTIEDSTLIGMGAIILNGAKIGKNCIIAAGALIPHNKVIPDNSLVMGSPGKIIRQVTEEEIIKNRQNAEEYIHQAAIYNF